MREGITRISRRGSRRAAEQLAATISGVDTTRARNAIWEYVGTIQVRADAEKISFYNAKGHPEVALSRAAGSAANYCGSGGGLCDVPTVPQQARLR
jgi:hypothetical protein